MYNLGGLTRNFSSDNNSITYESMSRPQQADLEPRQQWYFITKFHWVRIKEGTGSFLSTRLVVRQHHVLPGLKLTKLRNPQLLNLYKFILIEAIAKIERYGVYYYHVKMNWIGGQISQKP